MMRTFALIALVGQAAAVTTLLEKVRTMDGEVQVIQKDIETLGHVYDQAIAAKQLSAEDVQQLQGHCMKISEGIVKVRDQGTTKLQTELSQMHNNAIEAGEMTQEDAKKQMERVLPAMQKLMPVISAFSQWSPAACSPKNYVDSRAEIVTTAMLLKAFADSLNQVMKANIFKAIEQTITDAMKVDENGAGFAQLKQDAMQMMNTMKPPQSVAVLAVLMKKLNIKDNLDQAKYMETMQKMASGDFRALVVMMVQTYEEKVNMLKGQLAHKSADQIIAMYQECEQETAAAVEKQTAQATEMIQKMFDPETMEKVQGMVSQLTKDPEALKKIMDPTMMEQLMNSVEGMRDGANTEDLANAFQSMSMEDADMQ